MTLRFYLFVEGFCWSIPWTLLYKLRCKCAVVTVVVAVAAVVVAVVAVVAVVTAAANIPTTTAASATATTTATNARLCSRVRLHRCVLKYFEIKTQTGPVFDQEPDQILRTIFLIGPDRTGPEHHCTTNLIF